MRLGRGRLGPLMYHYIGQSYVATEIEGARAVAMQNKSALQIKQAIIDGALYGQGKVRF